MPSSLVTFALCVWLEMFLAPDPPPDLYPKLVFLSQSTESIFIDFTRRFNVVWSLFSLPRSSRRFMSALLYTRDWVNYHQSSFHQIVIKYAINKPLRVRLQSLSQKWLLSGVELNHLLTSHSSSLCWLWRLQRPLCAVLKRWLCC